jgi:hypothetical protein
MLDELKAADVPPAGFVAGVMGQIRTQDGRVAAEEGEAGMAKKVLIGLSIAAAALIAVFATTGWPIADEGTEGTIGAASRHQAQQLSSADVKLGDAQVQEFLQS